MRKKSIKAVASVLLALVICGTLMLQAFASEVVFRNAQGQSQSFTFTESAIFPPSDLFTNFKGLFPGDVRTQEITVTNNGDEVTDFYLRIEEAEQESSLTEEQRALLFDLMENKMAVTIYDGDGAVLYTGPYNPAEEKIDDPDAWIKLFTLGKGETGKLQVLLTVDKSVGGEYSNLVAKVDWVFRAQQEGDDPTTTPTTSTTKVTTTKTGGTSVGPWTNDPNQLILWISIAAIGSILLVVIVVLRRRQRDDERNNK